MKALRIVRKIIQKLFSRLFVVALGIMIQLVWLYMVLYQFSIQHTFANLFVIVLGVVTAVYVVSRPGNPAAKLAWTFLLLIVPLLGIVIYLEGPGLQKEQAKGWRLSICGLKHI